MEELMDLLLKEVEQGEYMQKRDNKWWTFAANSTHRLEFYFTNSELILYMLEIARGHVVASLTFDRQTQKCDFLSNTHSNVLQPLMDRLILMDNLGILESV